MSRVTSFSEWLLRQSFIWGGFACLAFYALLVRTVPEGDFLQRYFAGHPVAYCTTALFFMGLAALVIKFLGVCLQVATLESIQLPTSPVGVETKDNVPDLLRSLDDSPSSLQDSYLVRRLREALQYVLQKGSADGLDPHLRHLEGNDLSRMHHSYGMLRIILSTIPILGFLGTVIGITLAIGQMNLSGDAMEKSLPAVVSGLSVAFDTTALALSLSTVLLFMKYCVERVEIRLLAAVDANSGRQMVGRFQQIGTENDPYLASVCRMSEQLLVAVETGMEKSGKAWTDLLASTASTLDEALSGAVVEGLARHAEALNEGVKAHAGELEDVLIRHAELLNEGLAHHTSVLAKTMEHHRQALTEAEKELAQENRQHLAEVEAAVGEAMLVATTRQEKLIEKSEALLKEMQVALVEAAGSTVAQQEQLVKQGDILLRVVEATGQIKQLEDVLNNNLNALAGAHGFRETAASLSAAVQVLGARLGQPVQLTDKDDSRPGRNKNQAA